MTAPVPLALVSGPAVALVDLLDATVVRVPEVMFDPDWTEGPDLEGWRSAAITGDRADRVVVAPWTDAVGPSTLVDLGTDAWSGSFEVPFARWFAALGAGAERCADGGQVVAVVDRPPAKGAAGWSAVCALSDAVEVMMRSFALIHQPRGVRVNGVTTPARLDRTVPFDPAPVAAAVAMLLDDHASRVTASVIHLGGH